MKYLSLPPASKNHSNKTIFNIVELFTTHVSTKVINCDEGSEMKNVKGHKPKRIGTTALDLFIRELYF